VEKPPPHLVFTDLANAGLCVVEPGILDYIPAETVQDFGRDLFPRLLQLGVPIFGLPIAGDEFLVDIGTPAGLARGQALWQQATPGSAGAAPASQSESRLL
jgi:NDP-sugar pyrophosphorylase family protein